MYNPSKRNIIIISIILSIAIVIALDFILIKFQENQKKEVNSTFILKTSQIKSNKNPRNSSKKEETKIETNIVKEEIIPNQYKENNWRIFISKIKLDAPILEGTNKEVLRKGVGHFNESSKWQGNVCLAAHNRGYKYNFFQEIKQLEVGDIITYQKGENTRNYVVTWKGKIKETDFSYLKNTKENKITLITCVENLPEYRLCVQADEIKI